MDPNPEHLWRIASWIWDRKDEVRKRLSQIYDWFKGKGGGARNRPGILILGPGGSGKSTLAKLLSGDYDWLVDYPGQYDESIAIERYSLSDNPEVEIVVPPGQQHRRESTWPELFSEIAAGKYRGIINLAAYGYHTLGQISYQQHRLYRGALPAFIDAYLKDRRNDEVSILRELAPHSHVARGKTWLLTVVTKQDLWWPERTKVERYYTKGRYGNQIRRMLGQGGARRFRHELSFVSLVINNFKTGVGEELLPNAGGYDHPRQIESLRRLFETIYALREWEEGDG